MRFIYILSTTITLGMCNFVIAQESRNTSLNYANATSYPKDTLPGMSNSIVNSQVTPSSYGTCTLIKNNYSDRKITHYKNGYKIVTADKNEIVKVRKGDNGARKIKYVGEAEDLKYHKNSKGELHY